MWSRLGEWILDHPRPLVLAVAVVTVWLGYWALQVRTDHTAGRFVDRESAVVQDFQRLTDAFGQGQSVLYVVFEGADPFDPAFLQQLDSLTQRIQAMPGVEHALSLANVPYLVREDNRLVPHPLYDAALAPDAQRARIEGQRFLRGLLLAPDGTTTALMVKIDEEVNNTSARIPLVRAVADAAEALPGDAAFAGYPYLRTQYATRVTHEAPLFTMLALLVSLLFLFFTFRAWRAVVLPALIVALSITWTIGLIALFDHRLNIVTGVLPALLVIIGTANTIHLSTKFYDRYQELRDVRAALVQTIHTVGLATFLTSLTTAVGFGALLLSGSELLGVFGAFAAAGILVLYGLSIILIPVTFQVMRTPTERPSRLVTHDGFYAFFDRLAIVTQHQASAVLVFSLLLVLAGAYGATRISSDIYVFSDFFEEDPVRQDLAVFEDRFGGVLPMEVLVAADTPGQFRTLGALRRLDRLQADLDSLAPVQRTLSPANLVKLANQAYFGGHPATYRLPSNYEMPFLQGALQQLAAGDSVGGAIDQLPRYVDSTFTLARLSLGVPDIGTTAMNALADSVRTRAQALFPADRYDVVVTGNAIVGTRSGENLVHNLVVSLGVALVVIALLMALLFRSARLTLISLIPNLVPLLLVGGAMGYLGVLLKPSTALIFPLAFGIAVDDTIHFLAKYRIVRGMGLPRDEAIRVTLRETGKAILFTSLVLMAGFLVFTLSSFGATFNLGMLTAVTLAGALIANLLLLPALLYRFAPHGRPSILESPSTNGHGPAPVPTEER